MYGYLWQPFGQVPVVEDGDFRLFGKNSIKYFGFNHSCHSFINDLPEKYYSVQFVKQ